MQDSGTGGGGGNELSRASGLARFRSAPTTWLDALLEDDDSLKLSGPHNGLTHLLTSGTTTTTTSTGPSSGSTSDRPTQPSYISSADPTYFQTSGTQQPNNNNNTVAFQRMNSLPAEFLSANIEGYFSNFGGISSGFDFVGGSCLDVSPSSGSKRMRDNNNNDVDQLSSSFSSLRRGEQSGQLSTANSLVELEMEKLLEDPVPCRVRAKRGCATHPRSIAERVRRTRISDRIRKLQELVPNMDNQTNTADMLEEAVEYVKTLQRQIQELTEQKKKCNCMAKS